MINKIKALSSALQAGTFLKIATVAAFSAATVLPSYAAIDNTASVSGSTPGGGTASDSDTESVTTITGAPEYNIVKSVQSVSIASGDDALNPDGGDTITYQYVVTNTGNLSLDGATVSIVDPGPTFDGNAADNTLSALTLVAATDVGADNVISPTESWTYTATYLLSQGDVDNSAGITDGVSNTIDDTTTNIDTTGGSSAPLDVPASTLTATETIPENADIVLAKIATRDGINADDGSVTPYASGETITYRFEVENTGNVTLDTLTVSDTAFSGTGTLGAIVCSISGDATIATLAPGATELCTASYTILEADL